MELQFKKECQLKFFLLQLCEELQLYFFTWELQNFHATILITKHFMIISLFKNCA